MGCLRQGHSFSCVTVIEDLYLFLLATLLAVWTVFAIDRTYNCQDTVAYLAADPLVKAFVTPCDVAAKNNQVNASMAAFWVMIGIYIFVWILCNMVRPYDLYVVAKPIRHCHSCKCDQHVAQPGEMLPLNRSRAADIN